MTDIVERLRKEGAMAGYYDAPAIQREAADEIERLRAGLEKIVAMRPPIPEDLEGYGPSWEQYIYTRTWALFAASLQDTARAFLGGER